MLTALTRGVSSSIGNCELTYVTRDCIDVARAAQQHKAYEDALRQMGLHVVSLPVEPDLPDAVFVEDNAVIVDEVAVVALMGAVTRRPEVERTSNVLAQYRPLRFLDAPATLEGGDEIKVGRTLFVGLSNRTNAEGVAQLQKVLRPFDYDVKPVEVRGCLHLTTGASYLGNNMMLVNPEWVDAEPLKSFELIETPADEPWAANTIVVGDMVLIGAFFPRTRALLEERGFRVLTADISELEKAEAGLSCMSLIFEGEAKTNLDGDEAEFSRQLSFTAA